MAADRASTRQSYTSGTWPVKQPAGYNLRIVSSGFFSSSISSSPLQESVNGSTLGTHQGHAFRPRTDRSGGRPADLGTTRLSNRRRRRYRSDEGRKGSRRSG